MTGKWLYGALGVLPHAQTMLLPGSIPGARSYIANWLPEHVARAAGQGIFF
jgi:hypothetical protein